MICKILTFNAAIQDIRFFGRSFYCPVGHIKERITALAEKLLETGADVICLQEMFHRPLQDRLYNRIKHHYPYVCGFAAKGFKLRLGNELLIFSRFPLAGGNLIHFDTAVPEEIRYTSKGFFHTTVILEGHGNNIELINFHMTAGGVREHPESEKMNDIRARQIDQILNYAGPMDRIILAGDLNAGPHSSLQNYLQLGHADYVDTFNLPGEEGYTWDPANPLVARGNEAHLPPQRIDHIFVHSRLHERTHVHNTEIVLNEICIETETGNIPLSDHYGVLASLQFE